VQKRKKIMIISSAATLLVLVILIFAYRETINCKTVNIIFEEGDSNSFIDKNEILDIVNKKYPNINNTGIYDINTRELETQINAMPQVKKADVYTRLTGELDIKIKQRLPYFRVFRQNNESFYVDIEGKTMPVSQQKTARLIVVSGKISEIHSPKFSTIFEDSTYTLDNVYRLVQIVDNDEFMKAQIAQIYVTQNREYELVPLVGNHIVNLGDSTEFERKIRHLKHFYTEVLVNDDWNRYNYISLKFKNQIVCTINPYTTPLDTN